MHHSLVRLPNIGVFTALILTTVINSLLLAGDVCNWNLSKDIYDLIVGNRATTQIVVQVVLTA